MSLLYSALESILADCHESSDTNQDEVFGRDRIAMSYVGLDVHAPTSHIRHVHYLTRASVVLGAEPEKRNHSTTADRGTPPS